MTNYENFYARDRKYREPLSFSWHQNFDIIMNACEAYARRWATKEDVELDTLSEWIKSIGGVLKRRIRRLKHSVNARHESIFSDPNVVTEQKRSTEGCSKFKGPETRQVQERLVSTLDHMQVPKWDRTRCPEE